MGLELTIEKEFEITEFKSTGTATGEYPTRKYTFELEEWNKELSQHQRDRITLCFNDALLKTSGITIPENHKDLLEKNIVLTLKSKPLEGNVAEYSYDDAKLLFKLKENELLFKDAKEIISTEWKYGNLEDSSKFKKKQESKYAAIFLSPYAILDETSISAVIHKLELTITQEQCLHLAGFNTPRKMQVSYRLKEK